MSGPDEQEPLLDDAREGVAPMSPFAALLWTAGATLAFLWFYALTVALREAAADDAVSRFGCQLVAYLGALFGVLRLYAPNVGIRQFLGLRGTHFGFYPLAVVLGLAATIPINSLYTFIERRVPGPDLGDSVLELFRDAGLARQLALGAVFVVLGPILEEVLFRGALQKPLSRRLALPGAIVLIGVLFGIAHVDERLFVPIGLVGALLAYLRHLSGSLWPPVLAHMAFNAVPFVSTLALARSGEEGDPEVTAPVLLGATGLALALLALTVRLAKTERAARARREDDADHGDG
jgi:membrane protease YdiL (CAAX protease family)